MAGSPIRLIRNKLEDCKACARRDSYGAQSYHLARCLFGYVFMVEGLHVGDTTHHIPCLESLPKTASYLNSSSSSWSKLIMLS